MWLCYGAGAPALMPGRKSKGCWHGAQWKGTDDGLAAVVLEGWVGAPAAGAYSRNDAATHRTRWTVPPPFSSGLPGGQTLPLHPRPPEKTSFCRCNREIYTTTRAFERATVRFRVKMTPQALLSLLAASARDTVGDMRKRRRAASIGDETGTARRCLAAAASQQRYARAARCALFQRSLFALAFTHPPPPQAGTLLARRQAPLLAAPLYG